MKHHQTLALLVFSLLTILFSAQAQTDNIGHTRHTHHHNPPHPRAVVEERFFTNRKGAPLPLPEEKEAFVFGVFGDRTGGPVRGVSILADAVYDINLFEPDFVMTVGDLVQGYNDTPLWLRQMREYKGIMDELLCPWFPVSGNHDIYWRGDGPRPAGEHEKNYEMHFGPLWYAFEHKNSWFIALYSDEGNPKTGEKSISKPASQRMSREQFDWLKGILAKAKDADHIFLFLHHPRWTGGRYGDDWDKVHEALIDAGNVTAVFAGHIHRMRSDERDGIKYITLATTGGGQAGHAPEGGWLHHYNLVTVRRSQIAIATVPVGEVLDPLMITAEVSTATARLANARFRFPQKVKFGEGGAVEQIVKMRFQNPTGSEVDITLTPDSRDSRWIFSPDHIHRTLGPEETLTAEIGVARGGAVIDDTFRPPRVTVDMDYVTSGFRYAIPRRSIMMPLDIPSMKLKPMEGDHVLALGGDGAVLRVEHDFVAALPDGPMTLEAWFEADKFDERTALVAKTQNSEYGFFVSNGRPVFSIFVGGDYVNARGQAGQLKPGRLHHIAGVFDGREVRLYLDGKLVEAVKGRGKRKTNELDLIIGGDIDGDNKADSTLNGKIHAVRLSKSARYAGESFTPEKNLKADESSVFVTNMDIRLHQWVINESDHNTYGVLEGGAKLK